MTTNTDAVPLTECDFVAVPREAVEWLKEHYPALTEKAGMCERIGGRLYTKTTLATPAVRADAEPLTGRTPKVPTPTDVLEARAQGRAEALAIILGLDAETGLDDCTYSYSIGDTGDYGVGWDEDKLRELLRSDDSAWSLMQEAEGEYWHNLGLRDDAEMLTKQLQEQCAAIAAGGAQEPAAWKVDGLNGHNESAPGVWLKKVNADAAAAMLFRSSVTPLYVAPVPREAATVPMTAEQVEEITAHASKVYGEYERGYNKAMGHVAEKLRALLARQPAAIGKEAVTNSPFSNCKPAVPLGWRLNVGQSDERIWLTVTTPHGATASLSCADRNDSGRTIQGQVLMALKEALEAPAAPSADAQDELGAFEAAWSKVYDTGDFLLRHHTLTEQYANHDTQRAWEGWKLACSASTSANPQEADDDEEDDYQPTPESERAAFNAMMRWHLIRMLQAWRYGGDLRAAGMAAFEWARSNDVGKEAFKASEKAVKLAASTSANAAAPAQSGEREAFLARFGAVNCREGSRAIGHCGPENGKWEDYIEVPVAALDRMRNALAAPQPAQTAVVLDDELLLAAKDVLANGHQHDVGGGDVFIGTCDSTERLQRAVDALAASPQPVAQTVRSLTDVARLDWLDKNMFHREKNEWDTRIHPNETMWVTFTPKGAQGSARNVIDAAMTAARPASGETE